MEARISRNLLIVLVAAIVTGTALLAAYANTAPGGFGDTSQIKACQIKCSNSCCQVKGCLPPECGCGGGCSGSNGCAVDNAGGCGPKGCATGVTGNCCGQKACSISK